MRIRYKVALVGGIPIAIAIAIAIAAWLLLSEGERARTRASGASAAHNDLVLLTTLREEYVLGHAANREYQATRMTGVSERARGRLAELAHSSQHPREIVAIRRAEDALHRYAEQIDVLKEVTERNDQLVRDMNRRAASLVVLTDRARERQHQSNSGIIAEITEKDAKLRQARAIVGRAHDLQTAVLSSRLGQASFAPVKGEGADQAARVSSITLTNAAIELAQTLREHGQLQQAEQLLALVSGRDGEQRTAPGLEPEAAQDRLATWLDRLLKVNATEERSLHDELSQLLTYSVEAGDTEQATQKVAISVLELGRRSAEALGARDVAAIDAIVDESRAVSSTISALPISPLIQRDMVQGTEEWRDRLKTTSQGLRVQNEVVSTMSAVSDAMIDASGRLNALFTERADQVAQSIRNILLLGSGLGLLLGTGTAYVVARSITRPLKQLQDRMIALAADAGRGLVPGAGRRDELGAMARATNFFLAEIAAREQALRAERDKADTALADLRSTQASLIQAEKLASLGQLVAGVAHEINTPIGVALTTSTALDGDVRTLQAGVESGAMRRSELTRIAARFDEGSRILFTNLSRAAELVHSFKQVAADQMRSERRRFNLKDWLQDILTSLGPVMRKSDLEIEVECPSGLVLHSYPGAFAQIITNLVTNAKVHAYPDGRPGKLTLVVLPLKEGWVRMVFADDGEGIDPADLGRVFDPFFTTGRDRGSTGLGLHIIHNLVAQTLHGLVSVESTPGHGARFTVDVPIDVGAENAPRPQALA